MRRRTTGPADPQRRARAARGWDVLLALLLFVIGVAPASAQDVGGMGLESAFGDGFELQVAEDGGTIRFVDDEETGELKTIVLEKGVQVRSKSKLNLDCDILTYDRPDDLVVAEGKPIRIWSDGIEAECLRLEMRPSEDRVVLQGDAQVRTTPKAGDNGDMARVMRGEEIILARDEDGNRQVIIVSGVGNPGRVTMEGNGTPEPEEGAEPQRAVIELTPADPTPAPPAPEPSPKPVSIDENSLDIIPEPGIDDEG